MEPSRTRILIAESHTLLRAGLRCILEAEDDLEVAEVSDGAQAVAHVQRRHTDLVILNVSLPKLTGPQAARRIREYKPEGKLLMLSMHDREEHLFESLRVGAGGYILTTSAEQGLVDACRTVMRDELFLHPAAQGALVRDFLRRAERDDPGGPPALSPREGEVVKLIAEGHSSREIAGILSISVKTVERHRHNVLEKLGLHDRVALTRYAVRNGLIAP